MLIAADEFAGLKRLHFIQSEAAISVGVLLTTLHHAPMGVRFGDSIPDSGKRCVVARARRNQDAKE
jgi:hypothetical protein